MSFSLKISQLIAAQTPCLSAVDKGGTRDAHDRSRESIKEEARGIEGESGDPANSVWAIEEGKEKRGGHSPLFKGPLSLSV